MATERIPPRLAKGALIGADPFNPLASIILFDYNPEQLKRTLESHTGTGEKAMGAEAFRVSALPTETVSLRLEINAFDQLERGDRVAEELGILPQLAAIEMLLHPKTANVIANMAMTRLGCIEVLPLSIPMAIFVWGRGRVMPTTVTSYSVDETYHDHNLNPVSATVDLGLKVLTSYDLPLWHPGSWLYMAHYVAKEALATLASVNEARAAIEHIGEIVEKTRIRG